MHLRAMSAGGESRDRRLPLVIALLVVGVVGAAYYGYYRKQVAYFTGRNLRLLSMVAAQIEGQLPTENRYRPIFARRVRSSFDVVLVTDAGGSVRVSMQPAVNSSSLLYQDDRIDDVDAARANRTHSPIVIGDLSMVAVKSGWRSEAKPLKVATLANSTTHLEVTFDGDDYELFSQPSPGRFIICGLVSVSRFRYEVLAVSASVTLIAIVVALLAICSWPFLRIALIDRSQALTIGDVVLVVICTIVGAGVLTLAVSDAFAYRTMSQKADEQLEEFATSIDEDFARDVRRAMTELTKLEESTAGYAPGVYSFPPPIADAELAPYPYFDTLVWIDASGQQQVKFAQPQSTERVSVAERNYFKDALANRTWSVNDQPYVLQWVHTKTTGETRAIVAKHTTNPALPVIAMATELIDVAYAVRPPGVELAIVDENGEVVYHSDNERIGYENFFAEADRNRELRSAVIARRAGIVTARYLGEDTSMAVRPLKGSQWTIVAFRAKRLTRVLNVEGVLLSLLMLLLSSTPYLLLYIAVLLIAPAYRAPRLWPDATRGGDYLRLTLILIATLVLYWANDYILTPWSSFFGALILPAIAIVSTYLVLHRFGTPRRFAVATALWLIFYASYFAVLLSVADVDSGLFFSSQPKIAKAALVLLALGVATLTVALTSSWSGGDRVRTSMRKLHARYGYAFFYKLCGVLLLGVGVAMPVTAFFTISRHVESELLCKFGQLRAAADLEHRIQRIEQLNVTAKSSDFVLGDLATSRLKERPVTSTAIKNRIVKHWVLDPSPMHAVPTTKIRIPGDVSDKDRTIPLYAANLLPSLYEDSVAIRPLYEASAADDLWRWHLKSRFVTLVRRIRLDDAVAQKVWGSKPHDVQKIVMVSEVPQGAASVWHYVAFVVGALLLLPLYWYATSFIASRVLLIDVDAPRWMADLPLTPTLGDHVFLIRRGRDLASLTSNQPAFLDVSFAELDRDNKWDAMLETLDSSAAGANVRITDFEHGINDGAINDKKLQWLERLMMLPDRTLLIVSTIGPAFVMTTPPPPTAQRAAVLWYYDRWQALLDRFVVVAAEDLELQSEERRRRQATSSSARLGVSAPTWLEHETEYNSFLHNLRRELDPHAGERRLLDEISERADAYYAGLWSNCREEEKLLLYHLARNGLANAGNRRVLRSLMARGLVRRDPNVELFSETFRLYVLNAARREDLAARARAERPASVWDSLRGPFFIVIISFLLLLYATQKDLMTTTSALATALTGGLPVITKLLGVFTERRMDSGK